MTERAIFLNDRAAMRVALSIAAQYRNKPIPGIHAKVYPVRERGAVVGYAAAYLSGPSMRDVFEDMVA